MASKQLLSGFNYSALVNSATKYTSAFFGLQNYAWQDSDLAAYQAAPFITAGVISNFKVYLESAPGSGKSYTFNILLNGSSTGISVTISGTSVSAQDAVHSSSVSVADWATIEVVPNSTPDSVRAFWTCEFVPTTSNEFFFGGAGANTSFAEGYFAPPGSTGPTSYEERRSIIVPCDGTIKKAFLRIASAAGAGKSATLTARKNGSNQSLAATVSGATDLYNIDTSNYFSVSAGDILSFVVNFSSSMTRKSSWGFVFVPDDTAHVPFLSTSYSTILATDYPIDGLTIGYFSQTELFESTAIGIYCSLSVAPGAGTSRTFTLYKNGNSTDLSVTIANTDTSGSDSGSVTVEDSDVLELVSSVSGAAAASYLRAGVLLSVSSAAAPYNDGTPDGGIVFGGEVVEVATINASDGISDGGIVFGGAATPETEPDELHQVDGVSSGGLVFGGDVSEQWQAVPNNFVAVKGGTYRISGVVYTLAEALTYPGLGPVAAVVDCAAPPAVAGQFRYDLLSIDDAGTITVTAGTAATTPVMPTTPTGEVRLNHVLRYYGQDSIVQADIGKLWTAPAFSVLEISLSDDELAWAELTCTITATCRDQYGQLYTGSKSINASFISGNGTISPLVRSGSASSFTFTYTRDQAVTDVSPIIELRSPTGVFATAFIALLDDTGEIML